MQMLIVIVSMQGCNDGCCACAYILIRLAVVLSLVHESFLSSIIPASLYFSDQFVQP